MCPSSDGQDTPKTLYSRSVHVFPQLKGLSRQRNGSRGQLNSGLTACTCKEEEKEERRSVYVGVGQGNGWSESLTSELSIKARQAESI